MTKETTDQEPGWYWIYNAGWRGRWRGWEIGRYEGRHGWQIRGQHVCNAFFPERYQLGPKIEEPAGIPK